MKIYKSKDIDKLLLNPLDRNQCKDWSAIADICFSFDGSDEYMLIEGAMEIGKTLARSKKRVYRTYDEFGVYYFIGNKQSIINKIKTYLNS